MRYLVFLLVFTSQVFAQTIPIDLVIVKHKFATPLEQQQITRLGLVRLKETGVIHPVAKISVVRDSLNKNRLRDYTGRLDRWTSLAYRKGWCSKDRQCHLSLPPVFDSKVDYGGGVAYDSCAPRSASYSIARMLNGSRQARLLASITSVSHEVAHLDGAEHDDDSKNIMHSNALSFGERKLPWTLFTKELVDICLMEQKLRSKSRFGFSQRAFKGKIVEPLIK